MRIAILNLTAGGMSGGYRKYLANVIPRIAAHPEVETVLCVSPVTLNLAEWLGHIPRVEYFGCQLTGLIKYGVSEELKNRLKKFSPEVIFIPVERNFHFLKIPVVNMVQNMEPLADVNEDNPLFERVQHWVRAYLSRQGIRKADRVIAISKFVKEYLMSNYNLPEEKIGLIYYGSDDNKKCDAHLPSKLPVGWEKEFIFTAGSIRPTRGLEDVFLAMHYLLKEKEESFRLVIAGEANPNMIAYQNKLKSWIKKLGISDKVCWLNHLDDNEMAWCYKNCQLFVMSSRIESFGQIALEAMSHGCICLSASNPCLPEIFGDAASYYSPKDSQLLAKNIKSILSWNPQQKKEMAIRAEKRAAMFSWDVCAAKTVAELVKAIKNKKIKNLK